VPINAVVRSVSGWAAAVLIVGIVRVWRHLQTLAKCKANEPYEDDQCEKWPTQLGMVGSIQAAICGYSAIPRSPGWTPVNAYGTFLGNWVRKL